MVKAVEVQPKKAEGTLPTTGGQEENPYWMWIGGVVMLVGGLVAKFVRIVLIKSKLVDLD
jgi:LPXTG-motif cell wall-anchored protein